MATMTDAQQANKNGAVTEVAKWLASAAGEDHPTPLSYGDALDCIDGLLADGLIVLAG